MEGKSTTWERIWARSIGHVMGRTDEDDPKIPILSLKDARISLFLRTIWFILQVLTCIAIIANAIHHW